MHHGLKITVLYTAYKLIAIYENMRGEQIQATGTGFFVVNKDGLPWFVTNRHIVEPAYKKTDTKYVGYKINAMLVIGKRDTVMNCEDAMIDHEFFVDVRGFIFPEKHHLDIAVCPAFLFNQDGTNHTSPLAYHLPYAHIANDEYLRSLTVCDFVAFPGFPEVHDQVRHRPVMRMGTISSDPRHQYIVDRDDGEYVIYEAMSTPGNSGSPVFAVPKGLKEINGAPVNGFRDFSLIGINAGHFKFPSGDHQGLSYFYKSTEIIALINRPIRP